MGGKGEIIEEPPPPLEIFVKVSLISLFRFHVDLQLFFGGGGG